MRAAQKREVPGACESDTNRAVGRGKRDSQHSTRPKITAPRPCYRRPFPRVPLRAYYAWPAGLAYAVGMPWHGGRGAA
jgi:hypothetical protein